MKELLDKSAFYDAIKTDLASQNIPIHWLERNYYLTAMTAELNALAKSIDCMLVLKGSFALYIHKHTLKRAPGDLDVGLCIVRRKNTENILRYIADGIRCIQRKKISICCPKDCITQVYSYRSFVDFDLKEIEVEATLFNFPEYAVSIPMEVLFPEFFHDTSPLIIHVARIEWLYIDKLHSVLNAVSGAVISQKYKTFYKHLYDLAVISSFPEIIDLHRDSGRLKKLVIDYIHEEETHCLKTNWKTLGSILSTITQILSSNEIANGFNEWQTANIYSRPDHKSFSDAIDILIRECGFIENDYLSVIN